MKESNEPWIEIQGIKIRRHLQWQHELQGKELVAFETYSSGMSGGRNAEYRMKLCGDGSIHVSENVHVSVYLDGADGQSSTSNDSDSGTWEVYENTDGALFLKVNMKKSGEGFINFGIQDGKVVMNGRSYHVQNLDS